MKHVLVLLSIILASIPEVYADDDDWIDGIKIRIGGNTNETTFRMPWEKGENKLKVRALQWLGISGLQKDPETALRNFLMIFASI